MAQGFTKSVPLDTDVTLSGDSNGVTPSQHATKTYVDNKIAAVPAPYPGIGIFAQDEGIPLGTGTTMNFIGDGVSATVSGTVVRVFISGAFGTAQPLGFQANLPAVMVYITGTFTTSSNTGTMVQFGATVRDDWGGWNISDRNNIYVKEDGWYTVGYTQQWDNSATGRRSLYILVTGTVMGGETIESSADNAAPLMQSSQLLYLASGSSVSLQAIQRSGGNLNLLAGSTFPVAKPFWVSRLSVSGTVSGVVQNVTNTTNVVNNVPGFIIQDEGVIIGTGTSLNFVGAGVTASMSGTVAQILITGSSSGSGATPHPPEGRLTLVTGTPIMTASVATGTTLYYTPYVGDLYPSYGGASWTERTFIELSLVLDSNSGHTGYHQSGKNFDAFLYNDGGTDRLVTGPAWTSDIARSTQLERKNGILVNAASMTGRYGSNSGDTVTVAIDQGTYVGTVRMWSNGACTWQIGGFAVGGSPANFYLWNMYNRSFVTTIIADTTDSWTYASNPPVWRAANGSNTMRASFVSGFAEDGFTADYSGAASGSTGAEWGVGYDSTLGFTGSVGYTQIASLVIGNVAKFMIRAMGFHFLQAVENNANVGTATYYGDVGVNYFQSGFWFTGWF